MDLFLSGEQPMQPVPAVSEETAAIVTIAQYMLLAGSFVDIISRSDRVLIFAAFIKLLAVALLIDAAFRESNEQQVVPGTITTANKEKIAGALISLLSSIILTDALLREIVIRRITGVAQPSILPAVGGTGAFVI